MINDHWLQMYYKGWSNEALEEKKLDILRFEGSAHELKMVEAEIKRRKEAEEVA